MKEPSATVWLFDMFLLIFRQQWIDGVFVDSSHSLGRVFFVGRSRMIFAFASDLLTKKVTNLVIRLNHNEITLNQIKPEQNLNVLL